MKIGELAKRTGTKVVTIRYYEKRGLLPKPVRTEANYREYGEKDLSRLIFIRHCRRHGMSLEEIERLLQFSTDTRADHGEIHALIKKHLANIHAQIVELKQLAASLETMLNNCAGNGTSCDILESLGRMDLCAWCNCRHDLLEDALNPLSKADI